MKIIVEMQKRMYDNRKEYRISDKTKWCCDEMSKHYNDDNALTMSSWKEHPTLEFHIKGGEDYYDGDYCEGATIKFCLWCGEKVEIAK